MGPPMSTTVRTEETTMSTIFSAQSTSRPEPAGELRTPGARGDSPNMWWDASAGRWYPPDAHPDYQAPEPWIGHPASQTPEPWIGPPARQGLRPVTSWLRRKRDRLRQPSHPDALSRP